MIQLILRSSGILKSLMECTYHRGARFVGRAASFFLIWKTSFFFIWRTPSLVELYNTMSLKVIDQILIGTSFSLDLLGFEVEVIPVDRLVKIVGTVGVTVGEPCIGFEVMAVYVALIFSSFFSKNKARLSTYLLGGLALINLANIARIGLLAYLVQFDPYLWEVNHKYVFTLVVYFLVFGLWASFVTKEKKDIVS